MKHLILLAAVFSLCSCSHVVQIKMSDNSAADISVDGASVGKAPATYTENLAQKGSTYTVEAKLPSGKVVTQQVERSETSMGGVGAGAGAGVCGCLAISGAAYVLSVVTFGIGGLFGCLACPALIGGPVGGYFLAGQSPDVVTISADGTAPPRPSGAPPPPPAGASPPPPPPPALGAAPKHDAERVATAW